MKRRPLARSIRFSVASRLIRRIVLGRAAEYGDKMNDPVGVANCSFPNGRVGQFTLDGAQGVPCALRYRQSQPPELRSKRCPNQ